MHFPSSSCVIRSIGQGRAYSYERRAPSNVRSAAIAKEGDFRNYVTWCLNDGRRQGGVVITNYQVVHLSGSRFRNGHVYLAEPQEHDLKEALQFLDSIPFFGIVEEFEPSLRLLETTLKPYWHHLEPKTSG